MAEFSSKQIETCIILGGYGAGGYGGYSDSWSQGAGTWGGPATGAGAWNQGGGYGADGYGKLSCMPILAY